MKNLIKLNLILIVLFTNILADDFDDFDDYTEENQVIQNENLFLNKYNRSITTFNQSVYDMTLIPAMEMYNVTVPNTFRNGIYNVYQNTLAPIRVINNILQGKFRNALDETVGFFMNSTFGLFGIGNISENWFEIERHKETFSDTLGYWGVPSGHYIVLPIFGPTTIRDLLGTTMDIVSNPIYNNSNVIVGSKKTFITTMGPFTEISYNVNEIKTINKNFDSYSLVKTLYLEKRRQEIGK